MEPTILGSSRLQSGIKYIVSRQKIAILLEKNGMKSASKRTRHLNIRYFFLTDQIEKGKIKVEYCPTDEMIADYFTKPLQGTKFKKFRKMILNDDNL